MAVSSTSIRGFKYRGSLYGVNATPTLLNFIIKDSSTITIGDPVRLSTDGYLKRSAAGEPVLGVCVGLLDQNGLNVFSPRASGTTGSTLTPDDTLAVSSTNSSDGTRKLKAEVQLDPAGAGLWYNDADADQAQTNVGQYFDVGSTVGQISQSTASDTSGQFQLLVIDPDGDGDASKGIYRIAECQLTTNVNSYNSTAVISA